MTPRHTPQRGLTSGNGGARVDTHRPACPAGAKTTFTPDYGITRCRRKVPFKRIAISVCGALALVALANLASVVLVAFQT